VATDAPRPITKFDEGSFPEYVLAQIKVTDGGREGQGEGGVGEGRGAEVQARMC
jgi:hypothetical protein